MADVAQRQLVIQPARRVYGTLQVPGDKSIAHRYAMLGAIAEGTTDIAHLAPGEDVATSLACVQALGATIERRGPLAVRVTGCGARGPTDQAAALVKMQGLDVHARRSGGGADAKRASGWGLRMAHAQNSTPYS